MLSTEHQFYVAIQSTHQIFASNPPVKQISSNPSHQSQSSSRPWRNYHSRKMSGRDLASKISASWSIWGSAILQLKNWTFVRTDLILSFWDRFKSHRIRSNDPEDLFPHNWTNLWTIIQTWQKQVMTKWTQTKAKHFSTVKTLSPSTGSIWVAISSKFCTKWIFPIWNSYIFQVRQNKFFSNYLITIRDIENSSFQSSLSALQIPLLILLMKFTTHG